MERSYNQDAFYGPFNNGFSPGLMLYDWVADMRLTWALWCGPNNTNPFAFHIGNQYAGTGRVTFLPYYDEVSQGHYLFHIGGSGSIRRPGQNQEEIRAPATFVAVRPAPSIRTMPTPGASRRVARKC